MAVYSQQPTTLLGILLSWCISTVVASQTNCRQVESCSLHCTASIFLALWVTCGQQGQTMEASGSDLFMTVMTVQLISTGKIEMKPCQCLRTCACFAFKRQVCCMMGLYDMWTHGCVFSAAHHTVGHLVVMVYIHSGGVPNQLQASRVLLLALHCFHIPSPVGHLWPTRANHGSIRFRLVHDCHDCSTDFNWKD